MRLAVSSRLCSDLGIASDFLKNYFNQVWPLPKLGEGRQQPLGKGSETLGSVLRSPASAGVSGPLVSLPAPWSRGLCSAKSAEVQGSGPGLALCPPGLRRRRPWGSPGLAPGLRAARGLGWEGPAARCVCSGSSERPRVRVLLSFPLEAAAFTTSPMNNPPLRST